MSKQIDERIVEMRFDNAQFEKNVQTSMSTIDKLKLKLKFKGASDGFENLSKSAKKVDLNTIGNSAEKVGLKFSAMYTMADQAFRNITTSAMNAGKNIVKAFTITPMKTGFNEYELKMGSIQTIMASTGEELETVNNYLNELNEYSDKTIYSFSDMTQNIGKFTNAGVKLDDAVMAIKGISNEAAVSGANAGEASRAMYNFAQALSAGYVKLIDWKSIENANMATVEFKTQLLESAVAAGTLTKSADGMYKTLKGDSLNATKNFNESLNDQWMTTEVLVSTLRDYADETTDIGKKASQAATEVKTFSQMMDSLKESVQSGWAQTWELIFGDFNEGKALWTGIYNTIGKFLDKTADARNALIGGALGKNFKHLSNAISGMLKPVKKAVDTVKAASDALDDLGSIVDRVIIGEFGNGKDRIEKLTAAGYEYARVQNKVNEKLGSSVRHLEKAANGQENLVDAQKDSIEMQQSLSESDGERIESLSKKTDAELKALKIEDDQIKALRELQAEADKTGLSVKDFVSNIDNLNGRWLLLKGFENIGTALVTVFKSIGEAWRDIFPAMQSDQLYNIIAGFHKLTTYLIPTEETADKLTRTFKGLFAIIDVATTLVTGPTKLAFKIASEMLGLFGYDILDVTAAIGDALVAFRDWFKSIIDFGAIFDKIAPIIKAAVDKIGTAFNSIKDKATSIGGNIIEGLKNGILGKASGLWGAIVSFANKILTTIKNVLGIHSPSTKMYEVGGNVVDGLVNGIGDGISGVVSMIGTLISSILDQFKNANWGMMASGLNAVAAFVPGLKAALGPLASLFTFFNSAGYDTISGLVNGLAGGAGSVASAIANIGQTLITSFCNLLGIHSPSTVMFAIGGFLILGLIGGMIGYGSLSVDTIKDISLQVVDTAATVLSTLLDVVKTVFGNIAEYVKNMDFGSILAIGTVISAMLMIRKLMNIAGDLATGIKNIGGLTKSLSSLADAISNRINPQKTKFQQIARCILELAIAIGILAGSVFLLAQLEAGKLWSAVGAIAALGVVITVLGVVASKASATGGGNFKDLALMIMGIAAALFIMASVIKKLSFLNESNWGPILGGLAAMIIGLGAIIFALGKFVKGKTAQNIAKAGATLLMISLTMLLMVKVIKQVSDLDAGTLTKGIAVLTLFGAFVAALILSTQFAGKKIGVAGKTILQIGAAILLLTFAVKLLGSMDPATMSQGYAAILALSGIIVGLIWATKLAGKDISNIGTVMMGIGVAIGTMAFAIRLLGGMDTTALAKGVIAVTILSGIVVGLVAATRLAGKDVGKITATLLGMAGAIAILAGVAIVLSLISIQGLAKGIIAVGLLGGVMAGILWAAKGAEKCTGVLIALTLAIGVMTAAIAVLARIDTGKLAIATAAIGILMGLFATIVKVAGTAQKAMGAILVMTIAIGAITGCIYLLSGLPTEGVIVATVALSTFLTCMVGVIAILSAIGAGAAKAVMGAIALTALAIPLLAFVGVLALASNVNIAMENVKALVILATALTLLLIPLCLVGALIYPALLGVVALTAMAVPLLAFVGVLAVMSMVPNAITNAEALIVFVQAIAEVLIKLAAVSPLAILAVTALTMLVGVIATIGVMATAVGALMTKFPSLQTFLNTGIPVLIQLAGGIGQMMGAFVAGMASFVLPMLPQLGAALSGFMVGATPFINGLKMVDASMLLGVGILSAAIIALTSASFLAGVASFLSGGASFSSLGAELSAFAMNAMPFVAAMSAVNPAIFDGVKNLASAILVLTAADLLAGIKSFFGGETSFAEFGGELASMGSGIADFAAALGDLSEDQIAAIDCGARAIKLLAEAANEIPNEGGWAGKIFGENGLGQFGEQIVSVGSSLSSFVTSLGSFGPDQLQTIDYASQAISKMAEAAEAIPNEGGLVGKIVGENSIAEFGSDLPGLGTNLSSFATNLGTFGADQLTAVDNAAQAIIKMAEAAGEIPNEGGWAAAICGDNSLATFADKLPGLGTNLANFATNAGKAKKGEVDKASKTLKSVISLVKNADSIGDFDVETFGAKIASFGGKIYDFTTNLSSVTSDSLTNAINKVQDCVDMCSSLSDIDTSSMTSFGEALVKLATDGIKKFSSAIKSNGSKTDAKDAVQAVVDAAVKKIKSKDNYTKFKNAGKYCVQGFAKGIDDNKHLAGGAGTRLGNYAYQKAKEAIDSNSPSKKFAELGLYSVLGFAKGITDNLGDARKSAVGLGNAVLTATQDYLGIHSPSLVFNKEVGRYIVQGIAEGIKDETEAEKQAREKAEKIVNAFKEAFQKEIDKYNTGKSIADSELELWTLQNPKATDEEVYNKQLTAANEDLARQNHIAKLLHDQWRQAEELCKQGLMTMDEVNNFYDQYVKQMVTAAQASDKVVQLKSDMYNSTIDAINTDQSLDDAEWEFWKSAHKDASDEELDRQYELYLRGKLSRLWGIQDTLIEAAHEAENRFGKGSAEAKAAWQKAAENATSINETVDSIKQIAIDRKEAERKEFRNLRDLAIDNDDKLYQIWEKTLGRDATDEEKEARKLVSLTTKATNQTQLLNSARVEWLEAKAKFGEGSLEEQEAYQKYLDNELNLVTTQGEILDIQEAQEKRRERLIDKQNLAKSEYDEYIKKYKKYYEENGKTLDELEKDAKLVSGYDPSKVVETNNKKTTSAMATGLTNLGTAAAAGVGTVTSAMTSAASTFGTNFVSAISGQSQSWVDAGATLASAFLGGLTSNTDKIKETGKTLANATLEAIQESLDSDSRPVITPVLDLSTVNQQLASLNAVTSARQAAGISSSMSRDTSTNNQNGDEKLTGSNIYNYVQNNYSPKALSRTEIFRDTKTLLATKKGA